MDIELLPKSIEILGKTIKIKVEPLDDHGHFNLDKKTISLNDELSNHEAMEALRHECFHAILAIGGYSFGMKSKEEEALVRLLEHGTEDMFLFKFTKKKKK